MAGNFSLKLSNFEISSLNSKLLSWRKLGSRVSPKNVNQKIRFSCFGVPKATPEGKPGGGTIFHTFFSLLPRGTK